MPPRHEGAGRGRGRGRSQGQESDRGLGRGVGIGVEPVPGNRMVLVDRDEYENWVNRAVTAERRLREIQETMASQGGSSVDTQGESSRGKKFRRGTSAVPGPSRQSRKADVTSLEQPRCYRCRQRGHVRSNCPTTLEPDELGCLRWSSPGMETRMCYRCGEVGHVRRRCPQSSEGTEGRMELGSQSYQGSLPAAQVSEEVYQMVQREVSAGPKVVQGIF